MPYIADYLWQDVLAAARKLIQLADGSTLDKLETAADKLEAALEAAEGGSSDT